MDAVNAGHGNRKTVQIENNIGKRSKRHHRPLSGNGGRITKIIMQDLFSTAAMFYAPVQSGDPAKRGILVKELETILNNSGFLSDGEKEKMKKVIPMFSESVIEDLKQSLIRQNLRYLQRKMSSTK